MNALTLTLSRSHRALLSVAIAFAIGGAPAHAQEVDHSKMPMSTTSTDSPAQPMDHSAMGHEMPTPQEPAQPMDHSAMGARDADAVRPAAPTGSTAD